MDKQRYTEQQLRFLFEEVGDFAVYFLDLDGLITSWTPSSERCFGWSEDEVKGQHADLIYTPEDRERDVPRVEFETALAHERSEDKRWHLHKSGQRIYMSGAMVVLKNEAGERTGLAKLVRDLTAWKTVQEERDRALLRASRSASELMAVLQSVPEALIMGTAEKLLLANPQALRLLGLASSAELDRVDPAELDAELHVELRDYETERPLQWTQTPYFQALSGESSSVAVRVFNTATQRTRVFMLSGAPVLQGNDVVAAVLTMTDISGHKSAERSLAKARDAALSTSQMKTNFLAQMSHEIRTPMSGILGMSQLLLGTDLTPEQQEFASVIESSTRALLGVVNDVLDLSKVEAGKLVLSPHRFDLERTLKDSTELFRGAVLERGLELSYKPLSETVTLIGDGNRIRQVLLNMINNAVKFTRRGGITVDWDLIPHQGQATLALRVRDTGVGIPPEELHRVFEPFQQVQGQEPAMHEGSGLGLAICHRLVELMGGSLTVTSEVGVGSTFAFEIPVELAEKGEVQDGSLLAASHGGHEPGELKVLVVDDNPVNRKVASLQLQKIGHDVTTAASGEEALELLEREPYDIVFMDYRMPGMDGPATSACLRARQGPNRETPVIALTAMTMTEDRAKCLASGMNDYLIKPIVLEELRAVLQRWAPQRR